MKKHRKGKKYYKYRTRIFVFIICIVSLVAITYSLKYYNKNIEYVLKINDEYISKDEFLLYLYEQQRIFEDIGGVDIWDTDFDGVPAKEVAKNNTVDAIIFLKATIFQAQDLGITLTKQDEEQCKKEAISLKQTIENKENKNGIKDIPIEIYEKFKKDRLIKDKIYEYLTKTFVVDEKDFEKYFNNYLLDNANILDKVNLDYIFIQNNDTFDAREEAQRLANDITFNIDFKTLEKEPFIRVYKDVYLENNKFEKNIVDKIHKLREKSISSAIEGIGGFYIFKINSIEKPNMEEVRKIALQEYILTKKNEIYSLQVKSWVNDIKIKKNSEILSNI